MPLTERKLQSRPTLSYIGELKRLNTRLKKMQSDNYGSTYPGIYFSCNLLRGWRGRDVRKPITERRTYIIYDMLMPNYIFFLALKVMPFGLLPTTTLFLAPRGLFAGLETSTWADVTSACSSSLTLLSVFPVLFFLLLPL